MIPAKMLKRVAALEARYGVRKTWVDLMLDAMRELDAQGWRPSDEGGEPAQPLTEAELEELRRDVRAAAHRAANPNLFK